MISYLSSQIFIMKVLLGFPEIWTVFSAVEQKCERHSFVNLAEEFSRELGPTAHL